jgi:hypothetical protein
MVHLFVCVNNSSGGSSSITEIAKLDRYALNGDLIVLGECTLGSSSPVMKNVLCEVCALNGTYSYSVNSITGSSTLESKSVV